MFQPQYCALPRRHQCPKNAPYIFHYTYGLPFDAEGNPCDVARNKDKCVHWFTKRHHMTSYPVRLESGEELP